MDILFAVMPFAWLEYPAIGVSTLQAELTQRGFHSRVQYFNLDLAARIGRDAYVPLAFPKRTLVGEWFFADLLFKDWLPDPRLYVANILRAEPTIRASIPHILEARKVRHQFVEHCVEEIRRQAPRVVGFTSTFAQNCACLAVSRRLKQLPNPPQIIFGGANCAGEMGLQLLNAFPWIDYVFTGESEKLFPAFLQALLRGDGDGALPGVLKQGVSIAPSAAPLTLDLDSLPIPDYHDYMEQLRASPLRDQLTPWLLVETSRGCWWGAKQHCTFCGLNGETMAFRSKSPERILAEFATLAERYGVSRLNCVDNILNMKHLDTVFPRLIEQGQPLELFYEVKSNLKYDQLRLLRDAGLRSVQPGIESLSNEVLRLMRKGCTALQNIQFLRWSAELEIEVVWNLLFGFPGEPPSEYERMAQLVPLLTHLDPPQSCGTFRLDRFSPYFTTPEPFGITGIRPAPAYQYIYSLGSAALARLAYYFTFEYADGRDPATYTVELRREVRAWMDMDRAGDERPRLELVWTAGALLIHDTRPCAVQALHSLSGLAAEVYLLCDRAQSLGSLSRAVNHSPTVLSPLLQQLLTARLMIEVEGQYLSLAVWRNRGDGAPD